MYYTWTLVNAILNLSIIGNTHILLSNYSKLSVETQKTSTLSHPFPKSEPRNTLPARLHPLLSGLRCQTQAAGTAGTRSRGHVWNQTQVAPMPLERHPFFGSNSPILKLETNTFGVVSLSTTVSVSGQSYPNFAGTVVMCRKTS